MFFTIFWTTYVPVAIVILSLVGDWLRHSFQSHARLAHLSNRRGIKRGAAAKLGV